MGDPTSPEALTGELRNYVDAYPEDDSENFSENILNHKNSSKLSGFISRAIKRIGFSTRKNSVGQSVPDTWYVDAVKAARKIRDEFKAEGVDIVVNADQTFVRFHPESEYVIAPKGAR